MINFIVEHANRVVEGSQEEYKMAENEGIEPPPVLPGLVFETSVTNQHLPIFRFRN